MNGILSLHGLVLGNRYRMEREIGRGGMATVWSATDEQHGRRVAIKVLHPELAGAIGTDRFLREIRLTAELQHPGIVPILDSGAFDHDGVRIPWYAMPYFEGETLRSRLSRETQLPIDEALRIVRAVGQAVAAANRRNIVHRDLKPENVFLAGEHVYVVDFGVAKAVADTEVERLTSTGLAIGTPTYMSPEQAIAGTVDARSDQYSLAVMLYEMLTGEPPFAGPNQQATIARRLVERARPMTTVRSTIPSAVEQATLRALERTPADRFPSIDAFLDALSAPATSRPVRRLSRRAGLAFGGIVLVVMIGSVWAVTRGPAVDPDVVALYERGVRAYDLRTNEGVSEAASALGDAIRRDSSFAPAWNALAKTYARAFQRGFRLAGVPSERLIPLAAAAVRQSLMLDDSDADAWTTQGIVSHQIDPTNPEAALRSILRAIALDSSLASTWHQYAIMNADNGNLTAALDGWRRSVRLDPDYTQGLAFLALGHYWRGQYDSAAVWADSALRVDPAFALAHQTSTLIEIERKRFDVAQARADAAVRLSEGIELVHARANRLLVKARTGNPSLVLAELLGVEVTAGGFAPLKAHTAVYLAEVHAALGDIGGTLKALGLYDTPGDMHFQLHLRCSPTFAPVEHHERFKAMLVIPRPARGSHC